MAMLWRPVTYVHRFFRLTCAGPRCSNARFIRTRCGRRTCPDCRRLDYFRLRELYGPALDILRAPKLLTLTLRNVSILSPETVAHLRHCMKKLWKFYGPRIRGGIYAIEAVNTGRGWHVHAHALIDADYLDQAELSRIWLRITGDSQIVDIRQAFSPQGALTYILKYLAKAPDVPGGVARNLRDSPQGYPPSPSLRLSPRLGHAPHRASVSSVRRHVLATRFALD